MLKFMKGRMNNNRGSTLVVALVVIIIFFGVAGMVVDAGVAYDKRLKIQKAANASALSGAQLIMFDEDESRAIAEEILELNHVDKAKANITITAEEVIVEIDEESPTFFMKIFGRDKVDVGARAKAVITTRTGGTGTVPVGIDKSINLVIGEEYTLKVDEANQLGGWFGALTIDGSGANEYRNALKYGAESKIEIGDILDTETGNIVGPTRDGVEYRIEQCDHLTKEECIESGCERIMLVPIYEVYPEDYDKKQIKQIKVVGFAYFYLLEMAPNGKEIKGEFVIGHDPGTGNESGATNYGAYVIKLSR